MAKAAHVGRVGGDSFFNHGLNTDETRIDEHLLIGKNHFMSRYECADCNKNLHGHPKIKVEDEIYCYSCAKQLVAILDAPAEAKHAKETKAHDIQYEKWKKWNEKRELALPSPKTQMWIVVGVAIGCAVFLADPIFFIIPGLIVGFIVNHFYFHNEKKDWIRRNPEPVFPASPSSNFVRDRIELVGGISGTALSSGYQKKILERDGYKCQICGQTNQLEVHHIKPQAKGGRHFPANLITLCYDCHLDENWFGHSHKMRQWHRRPTQI